MKTGPALTRAPFVGTVEASACKCDGPVNELFTSRTAEKAIAIMTGYWSIYLTFFGEQMNWLRFTITDVRDGTVIWRNGRAMKEEEASGEGNGTESPAPAGDWAGFGRWIGEQRRAGARGSGTASGDGW